MVVKREKKPTKKRKVTTKKKSKSKPINKNINTQTVIINQPKPTRRRKSTTTKKTDKFGDPTSSLGVITNLITRFQPTQQANDQLQQLTESVKQLQLQAPPLTEPPKILMPDPLSRNPSMASTIDFSTAETTNPDAFRENIKQPPERPYNLRSFSNVSDLTMEAPLSRNAPVKKADGSLSSVVAPPPPIPPPPMDKRKPATKKEPVIPPNQTTIPFATQKAQAELTQAMTSYEKMKIRYEEALRNDKIKKSTLQSYKSQLKTAEKKVEDVRLKNAMS